MSKRSREGPSPPGGQGLLETYRRLERSASLDELHDRLLADDAREDRHYLEVLTNTPGYIRLRLALDRRKEWARDAERRAKLERSGIAPLPPLDPLALLEQREVGERLVAAIAQLDSLDQRIVWHHAEGLTDREIHAQLVQDVGANVVPSVATIRKRRQRARTRLRDLLMPP